jgi:hypothetical protein
MEIMIRVVEWTLILICMLSFLLDKFMANCFRFYDTFATRDRHGHRLQSDLFPYFSDEQSRSHMLNFLPVPVSLAIVFSFIQCHFLSLLFGLSPLMHPFAHHQVFSCWNGMVVLPMEPFLSNNLRFRSLTVDYENTSSFTRLWFQASECCLIFSDLHRLGCDFYSQVFLISFSGLFVF